MIKEKIQQDLKDAQFKKDEGVISVLRQLLAVIQNKEIEKRTKLSKSESIDKLEELSKLTDDEIIDAISSEVKKIKESMVEFEKGGRQDLVESGKKELIVLEKYLPEQLSEEEIKNIIKSAIEKTGAKEMKDMGRVMSELMPKLRGKADNGIVSKIVKESLS